MAKSKVYKVKFEPNRTTGKNVRRPITKQKKSAPNYLTPDIIRG